MEDAAENFFLICIAECKIAPGRKTRGIRDKGG
jgi:hypothetical protein